MLLVPFVRLDNVVVVEMITAARKRYDGCKTGRILVQLSKGGEELPVIF